MWFYLRVTFNAILSVADGYEGCDMRKQLTGLVVLVLVLTVGALTGAGVAIAATAPSASTGPVTAITPTTATVSGSVNPNGTATTWHVEYGTTTGYGAHTTAVSAGSGTTSTAVSAPLASLKPGTTYHYRFVATSTAGTGNGADGILTTSSGSSSRNRWRIPRCASASKRPSPDRLRPSRSSSRA